MPLEVGAIKGVLELKDEFTSTLGLAQAALGNFSKEHQESMKAVASAGGLAVAAIGAVATAVVALGNRGADVNDVTSTLEHFVGGAKAADEVMQQLRAGTLGTVDNFKLAGQAAHLLSAGVKLTADDFGVLGSAAFVLQNRGLGGTKEMLDLVSDAMVTGRTRALSMSLGVVDVKDAAADYAKTLGITAAQLSTAGVAEANRIAIMKMLRTAVKDAGAQERDFGEQLEAGRAFVTNWLDSLGSAIAKSPVFAAGMKAIGDAFKTAFSGDQSQGINTAIHLIERGAILVVDFGLGAIEMARVMNVAWSIVKAVVLGTTGEIMGLITAVTYGIEKISAAAETLKVVPPGTTAAIRDVREQMNGMTLDLAKQTAEALKGVVGHSEFDATLDKLGGTLFTVRDAMVAASDAETDNVTVTDIAAENTKKLMAVQKQLADQAKQSMIDQAEVAKAEAKSLTETSALWSDYYAMRVKNTGSTEDYARSQIEATFQKEVAKLKDLEAIAPESYKKQYGALRQIADETLKGIETDWDSVKDKSIEALQQAARKAKTTYDEMVFSSQHFTRAALEEQLQKVKETAFAASHMGQSFVSAEDAATLATKKHNDELEKQKKIQDALDAAAANRAMGGSMQYDLTTAEGRAQVPPDIAAFLKAGWSFKQAAILAYAQKMHFDASRDPALTPKGPRVPGFAEGGMVILGEQGPEAVRLPFGSTVFPNGMNTNIGSAGSTTLNFYVNGTAVETAKQIKRIIMDELKTGRKFGQ